MLKFLLVLLVVGIGFWALTSRLRGPRSGQDAGAAGRKPAGPAPAQMVECAHCGVHLPAADALAEGSRLYCSDAHRRLGPPPPPAP
jgi:uncharacterized protein